MIQTPDSSTTLQNMLNRMVNTTPINAVSPGSFARSFLEVINTELQTCYATLDLNATQFFLSEAKGKFLDNLGELVGVKRLTGETDDNFRYRIKNSSYLNSKVTETAIRLACLSVDGVQDATIQRYSHGIGSFSVFITPQKAGDEGTRARVQAVLDNNQALGVKGYAILPEALPVALTLYVTFTNTVSASNSDILKRDLTTRIKQVFNSTKMGTPLNLEDVMAVVMQTTNIKTASISGVKVNGELIADITTIYPKWNEQLIIDSITYIV